MIILASSLDTLIPASAKRRCIISTFSRVANSNPSAVIWGRYVNPNMNAIAMMVFNTAHNVTSGRLLTRLITHPIKNPKSSAVTPNDRLARIVLADVVIIFLNVNG
jgi:hypothetical protein